MDCLIDACVFHWSIKRLIDSSIGRLTDCSFFLSVDRLIDINVVHWTTEWLIDWLMNGFSIGRSSDWLIDLSIDWSIDWLFFWLFNWLIGWLVNLSYFFILRLIHLITVHLYFFSQNDDAFIGLVELEVHQQQQLAKSNLKIERLLDTDLTSILAFCPGRETWRTADVPAAPNTTASSSRPVSATKSNPLDERGFPDLCKRWPLTGDEKCRYYLRIFFLLRRLSNKMQKISSLPPPSVTASAVPADLPPPLVAPTPPASVSLDEMPAPFQSVLVGDVVDISSCDTILSCTVIPFHTHLATRPQVLCETSLFLWKLIHKYSTHVHISYLPKQTLTQSMRPPKIVFFQRGEYTKPMGFDGWFFKGGSK